MADLSASKDVVDVGESAQEAQEADKAYLVSRDGFSSTNRVNLDKFSGKMECGSSSTTVASGTVVTDKEHANFGPFDLQKLYYELSQEQRLLIQNIGLGGAEWINKMVHTDLNHSAWLMLNVMPDDRALRIGSADCDIVHLTETAVASITGNRMGGSSTILVSEGVVMPGEIKAVRSILNLPDLTKEISVSELVALLIGDRKAVLDSSSDEGARTERAFAMLYLSIALGQGDKKFSLNRSSYMMLIMHPDLRDVNWGKYAIDEIVTGARRLNRDNALLNITLHGCPVILEILYFDSVDTGFIQIDKKAFPRIKHYNRIILHALVKANSKVEGGRITFGLMKVKEYSNFGINLAGEDMIASSVKGRNWIFEELAQQAESRIERSIKLHEELTSEIGLTDERNVKIIKAHRSLERFMLTVATAKVLRFVQKHEVEGGAMVNETVSSLDKALDVVRDSFARGCKRKASPDLAAEGDAVAKVPDLNIPLVGSSEIFKGNTDHSDGAVNFNQAMMVLKNPIAELDCAVEEIRTKKIHLESNLKKVALPIIIASCPFEFQSMYPTICNETLEKGYKNMILCFKKTLNSPWIIHEVPRRISLTGEQVGGSHLTAVTRRQSVSSDDQLFPEHS